MIPVIDVLLFMNFHYYIHSHMIGDGLRCRTAFLPSFVLLSHPVPNGMVSGSPATAPDSYKWSDMASVTVHSKERRE